MKPLERAANAALLLLGMAVGLACAEMTIRVVNGARYAERPSFYPRDPELGWAPAPGLDDVYHAGDYAVDIRTDDRGTRLGALGPVPESVPVVALIGDSYTFGAGVSTAETYASSLDERLRADGMNVRVVNLGVAGYGTVQSARRLARWLEARPRTEVRTVVVLHSPNDPADDVLNESVRLGLREYRDGRRNDGLHLHNVLRLVRASLPDGLGTGDGVLPGGYRDFMWTVATVETEAGRRGRESGSEVMAPEQGLEATYRRGSLTPLQASLLRRSIAEIDSLCATRGARVLHTAIHNTPSWYLDALAEAVRADAELRPGVAWKGPVDVTGFEGPFLNDHSGSHFTPALNERYAMEVGAWIEAEAAAFSLAAAPR